MVAEASDSYTWSSPQSVELTLTYPVSGTGAILTYVEILVNQDNYEGDAYLVSGGIGQRQITIVVLAYNTRNFSYLCQLYGV